MKNTSKSKPTYKVVKIKKPLQPAIADNGFGLSSVQAMRDRSMPLYKLVIQQSNKDKQYYPRIEANNGRIVFAGEGSKRFRNALVRMMDFRKNHLRQAKYRFLVKSMTGIVLQNKVI